MIKDVRLAYDDKQQLRGFGYLDFIHKDITSIALQVLKNADIQGRIVRVDTAVPLTYKSKPTESLSHQRNNLENIVRPSTESMVLPNSYQVRFSSSPESPKEVRRQQRNLESKSNLSKPFSSNMNSLPGLVTQKKAAANLMRQKQREDNWLDDILA